MSEYLGALAQKSKRVAFHTMTLPKEFTLKKYLLLFIETRLLYVALTILELTL